MEPCFKPRLPAPESMPLTGNSMVFCDNDDVLGPVADTAPSQEARSHRTYPVGDDSPVEERNK